MGTNGLWAITSYFNPVGYHSRLANYRVFREQLPVPLVTVELSFGGGFELGPKDATVLVQIRGGDVMWQKERLLNIALGSLPADCDTVAWVDCDVLFGTDDWPVQAGRALDRYGLVHLFEERHNVPGRTLPESDCARSAVNAQSVVSRIARGKAVHEDLADANAPVSRGSTAGLAWASRRHILERHGFYDACILGTGDRAMLCAALGRFDCAIEAMRMNPARARHYLAWAKSYFETVGGQVGWITGTAYHLWHGDPGNRRYADRHRWLDSFDPATDIALDQNRCWRWSSNKPELHAVVRQYFELRDEDRPS